MYNEEKIAKEKIENFLAVNRGYTLRLGSDGSTDGTNAILEAYQGVPGLRISLFPRRGKVHVLNDLIARAEEDILVFTDANTMFESATLEKLLIPFRDDSVGAVCGRLNLVDKTGKSGEGLYWRYETAIKRMESRLSCLIGANGAIYAVRRKLVAPIPENTINDDFVVSVRILEQGFKVLFADDAVVTEEASGHDGTEFKRHVRDGAGHYRAMRVLWKALNPLRPLLFFLYVSHRVVRWIVPFFLALGIAASLFHNSANMTVAVAKYGLLALAAAAVLGRYFKHVKALYVPYYFCYINMALLCGFFWNLANRRKVSWNTIRN
jgi:cellulose synthase/poly-beta-1,6-N-acetylglucosamine synthase-like glycosyltransferase